MATILMVSTSPPVALVSLPPARIVEMVSHFENSRQKHESWRTVRFYFRRHIHSFINEMWGNGKRWGDCVLDRAWRWGWAASKRLRPRVISGSLLMVRFVLLGCLGVGTVVAQTIRPDDLTVLMAADAVHKGSVKTVDMGQGKVGWVESWDPSASLVMDCKEYRTWKLCSICDSSRQW
jgi:hypothetical protein